MSYHDDNTRGGDIVPGSHYSYAVDGNPMPRYSYQNVSPTPPPEENRGKKKSGIGTGAMVSLCICCAIVGGILGGGITYLAGGSSGSSNIDAQIERYLEENPLPSNIPSILTSTNSGDTYDTAQIYALCNQSAVSISVNMPETNAFGYSVRNASSGSGFVYSADGYIVTNAHVVKGGTDFTVTLHDGTSYPATLIGSDDDNEVAVLKIDAKNLTPVTVGDSDSLMIGNPVYAIGNPLGEFANSLSSGVLSARDREINIDGRYADMLQFTAAVNPGNSGGPLFSSDGRLYGIVTAKSSGTGVEGIGFAIPINKALPIVQELIEKGFVEKPYFGISVYDLSATEASYYSVTPGVYVTAVEEGSPAAAAGITVGDRITAINDKEVTTGAGLSSEKNTYQIGDTVTLTVSREGTLTRIDVTLGTTPNTPSEPETPAIPETPNTGGERSYIPGESSIFPWEDFGIPSLPDAS